MSVLSAQSIRRLCSSEWREGERAGIYRPFSRMREAVLTSDQPLITPFTERGVANGKSYGLSACTYDCRIDQDLVLEPMPFGYIADMLTWLAARQAEMQATIEKFQIGQYLHVPHTPPPPAPGGAWRALASTVERFVFPHNVRGHLLDKSTYARVFVSAFNTHFDPGFDGHATIELINLGGERLVYQKGDAVCQFLFEWLDEPTDLPYVGRKYSDQPNRPVAAISEGG